MSTDIPGPPPSPNVKPGWQTSEWYTTLAAKIFSLLVAVGVIGSSDADAYTKGISGIVAGVFIVASTWLAGHYASKRTALKGGTSGNRFP